MASEPRTDHYDPDRGEWVPDAPLPFCEPPSLRSTFMAWLRSQPRPAWRATRTDPNPNERWWRRG